MQEEDLQYAMLQVLNSVIYYVDEHLKPLTFHVLLYPFRHVKKALPENVMSFLKQSKRLRRYIDPVPQKVRRYIDPEMGVEAFFDALNQRNVRYVALRWFEGLPEWPANEDIDLLIDDRDFGKLGDLFVRSPETMPCDLFSVTARSSYNGLPYYPPYLASSILKNRVLFKDRYYIPSPEDHFFTLAYHVVYHKAEKSGLPLSEHQENEKGAADHPYAEILTELAQRIQLQVRPTLSDLHDLLDQHDWTPQLDTLRKLAEKSEWLRSLLHANPYKAEDGELLIFIAREWVVENNKLDFIMKCFQKKSEDFDILKVIKLDEAQRQASSLKIRGGEWGRGPFPVSGGRPGVVIAAYDYHPAPVPEEIHLQYPYITDGNILFKHQVRDEVNNRLLWTRRVNCMHSSDDEIEGWEYLKATCAESTQEVREEVQKRRNAYRTSQKVLAVLDHDHARSKVELIEYSPEPAVKKTFKWGRERFCEREKFVYSELSSKHPAIPNLLDAGDHYLIIPYYQNILAEKNDREKDEILASFVKDILDILKFFYKEGFALVEFMPDNFLVTQEQELKIVDFEFLYRYKTQTASFSESFDLAGLPSGFDGDRPCTQKSAWQPYEKTWQAIVQTTSGGHRMS